MPAAGDRAEARFGPGLQQPGRHAERPGQAGRRDRLLPPRPGNQAGLCRSPQQSAVHAQFLPGVRRPHDLGRTPRLGPPARRAAGEVDPVPRQRSFARPPLARGLRVARFPPAPHRAICSAALGIARSSAIPNLLLRLAAHSRRDHRALPGCRRRMAGRNGPVGRAAGRGGARGPDRHSRRPLHAHGEEPPAGLRAKARPGAGHVSGLLRDDRPAGN